MMIHAYHEMHLRKAMHNIGDMFDFAINDLGLDRTDYAAMFAGSTICRRIENGEPKYLIGMSGAELAIDIIQETTGRIVEMEGDLADASWDRSPDYWCGWAAFYYQWLRTIPYKELFRIASYEEISSMYRTLHEADVTKFAEAMDQRRAAGIRETNLKRIRTSYGCSQSELARMSGVSLRSIQMYEQRNKDINRGQLETITSLARALGCRAEDLLEPAAISRVQI